MYFPSFLRHRFHVISYGFRVIPSPFSSIETLKILVIANSQYRLWIWLAEAEKELGLDISDEAITQMKAKVTMTDIDFEIAAAEER